jgi:hypothetical protein
MNLLKAWIPKNAGRFGNNLIGEDERMAPAQHGAQQFPSIGTAARMRTNQNGRVQDDSQMTGL